MSTVEDDEHDLTRKQRREQARAQRKELEEAHAASALRRTRLTQLGIVAVIVVAIIVGIVIATSGGSKTGLRKSKSSESALVQEINALLGGIPQSGNTLGSPTAPVTLRYDSRLYHIGLGRAHKGRSVRLLVADRDVRVIDTNGELIRELTLDPSRDYQRLTPA